MTNEPIRILYIEDDEYDVTILQETLRSSKDFASAYTIIPAHCLNDGLMKIHSMHFDLILLDMNLPEGSGRQNVEIVRQHAPEAPIVCLTSMNCDRLAMEALQSGAQEYIVKGYCNAYIMNRIIRSSIFRKRVENRLNTDAKFDNTTGLPNNIYVAQTIETLIKTAQQTGQRDAMLLLAIHDFQKMNTRYGHEIGREVAVRISERIGSMMRSEFAGCMNEGELVIYLTGNTEDNIEKRATALADKMIDACGGTHNIMGEEVRASVNIGIAIHPDVGMTFNDMLDSAYDALFIGASYGPSKYCIASADFMRPKATIQGTTQQTKD